MILIIDNGSQYTHLIKRNCRDLGFESEVVNNTKKLSEVSDLLARAERIILSGGPSSVTAQDNGLAEEIVKKYAKNELAKPLLGVCFGHQLIAHALGGTVEKGKSAEYGITQIIVDDPDTLFEGVGPSFSAWASHFDEVKALPPDFIALAHSDICKYEAMRHATRPLFSVQFHPEVWHTEHGEKILENFLKIKG